jgi:hypothetical protein
MNDGRVGEHWGRGGVAVPALSACFESMTEDQVQPADAVQMAGPGPGQ